MPKEHKLPKPVSSGTDAELLAYSQQFDVNGDRRKLAEEILRLRKIADGYFNALGTGTFDNEIRTQKPVKEVDNALI